MSSSNESTQKTVTVALVLCLVCSIIVSAAAVILRPAQAVNEKANMQMNILQAAGLYDPEQSIADQFQIVTTRLVNIETGEFVEDMDAERYNQRRAAKDPSMNRELSGDEDIASIKRQAKIAKIYLIENGEQIEKIILPIHGYGLWSTLYGFMALEGDANTVAGLGFYEHAETPGLGGEVDNPNWKAKWPGKLAYKDGEVAISVLKGAVNPSSADASWQVDGLSGATLTSKGIHNLVQYWLGDDGFAPLLGNIRGGNA